MKTTLNKIRAHKPCADGWKKLLQHLGKTQPDDEPLSILIILDSNGLADALWCLRAVEGYDREIRLYAIWCARQVQHLMTDQRSINAIDVAERFANGQAFFAELAAAAQAARAAAGAALAAYDAAGAALAALAAAGAAAWAAADVAEDATWAASAAADAAWDAAWAARAALAASAAAWAAENAALAALASAQEEKLREMCSTGVKK